MASVDRVDQRVEPSGVTSKASHDLAFLEKLTQTDHQVHDVTRREVLAGILVKAPR